MKSVIQNDIKRYDPFGMLTPGRDWSAGSEYRFGFNGMEGDPDLTSSGNHYTTLWRQYDPRLGCWMSTEPKPVAWESLYASFRNNPIYYSDPNGDWVKGAGFFRNLFNSDDKIDAENKAAKIGGDAQAYKNEEGGWNVSYTEGEMVDLGDGEMLLKTLSIENFDKHSKSKNAQNGGVFSGEAGNWLASGSFVTGAAANQADKILVRNYHGYNQKSIIRTLKPFPNLRVSTSTLKTTSSVLKVAGPLAGAAGLYLTYDQYGSGEISGTQAKVDVVFGVIGFFGLPGAAISVAYFGGKAAYEYFSGEPVFDKPEGY